MLDARTMTDEMAMQIFKHFDKELYDFYLENARTFGLTSKCYAECLAREHGLNTVDEVEKVCNSTQHK